VKEEIKVKYREKGEKGKERRENRVETFGKESGR
jgi:hypothetical protein